LTVELILGAFKVFAASVPVNVPLLLCIVEDDISVTLMNGVSMDVVAFIIFPCTSFVVVILVVLIVVPVMVDPLTVVPVTVFTSITSPVIYSTFIVLDVILVASMVSPWMVPLTFISLLLNVPFIVAVPVIVAPVVVIVVDDRLDVSILVASILFTISSSVFAAGKGVSSRASDS
jgi:hypothetical protein